MFLELAHTKLDVFQISKAFVLACYRETRSFPSEEKFGMISQIRRAALSVHLNVAEGCSRKSLSERKRFYEIARGSIIEIDTSLDIAIELKYTSKQKLEELGGFMIRSFQMISKLIS
jgi:four helix bundle protein